MAPIKFEKHIKDKLKEREIRPSDRAWQKISEGLQIVDRPRKTNFFWYGIAAGFIGLLVISVLYFKSGDAPTEGDIQIVDSSSKTAEKEQGNGDHKEEITEENLIETEIEDLKPGIEGKTLKKLDYNTNTETGIAAVQEVESINTTDKIPQKDSEKIIDTKIAEVIAQVNLLELNDKAITEAEVDSLLRQAQKEILTDKIFRENRTVDATALLSEVEDELDESFRDQIFEKLKTGYIKVRTAVADRNN